MSSFNSKIKIDRAIGAAENISTGEEKMSNSSKKMPWHLRFAPGAVKPKEIAATAGIGTIYGLLFAGLLLSPLPLPSGKVQAQCAEFDPNDCANPCYVSRPDYSNDEFHDANSREDCDRILQEVLKKIKKKTDKINAARKAAERCDTTYDESLKTNNVDYNRTLAEDRATVRSLFLTCMGLGVGAGAASSVKKVSWTIRGGLTVVVRVGSAALGTVVTIGATAYCISLRNSTAESLRETRDAVKEEADSRALRDRNTCREDTDYDAAVRKHRHWSGPHKGRRDRWLPSVRQKLQDQARADHQKCLEQFPSGDCGTTD